MSSGESVHCSGKCGHGSGISEHKSGRNEQCSGILGHQDILGWEFLPCRAFWGGRFSHAPVVCMQVPCHQGLCLPVTPCQFPNTRERDSQAQRSPADSRERAHVHKPGGQARGGMALAGVPSCPLARLVPARGAIGAHGSPWAGAAVALGGVPSSVDGGVSEKHHILLNTWVP